MKKNILSSAQSIITLEYIDENLCSFCGICEFFFQEIKKKTNVVTEEKKIGMLASHFSFAPMQSSNNVFKAIIIFKERK
jgi:hypothetical protein